MAKSVANLPDFLHPIEYKQTPKYPENARNNTHTVPSHAGNTGSNPIGVTKEIQALAEFP